MLAAGTITAPALVDLYLDRIARLDPGLRAYRIVLADSARQEAAAAQARLDAGERLPLLGVPIAIKDDVDVAGEVTTYGSAAHGPAKTDDAEVVRKLRAAGAVIVGKTAVPEMMLWSFTETVAFGATRNPWNTDYTPGRQQRRQRRGGRGGPGVDGSWFRRYGLDPHPVDVVRPVRDQTAARPSAAGAARRRMERPECERADGKDRRGRRALPRRHDDDARAPTVASSPRPAAQPGRLRIALSTKLPPLLMARIGRAQRAAVRKRVKLLRELGHDVIERDPDYPTSAIVGQALPRYFRGVYDDVQTLPHPERLEARTREFARIGGLFSDRRMNSIRAAESQVAATGPVDLRRRRRGRHAGHRGGTIPHRCLPTARRHIDSSHGGRAGAFPGDVQRERASPRRSCRGASTATAFRRQSSWWADHSTRRRCCRSVRRSRRRGPGRSAAHRCPNHRLGHGDVPLETKLRRHLSVTIAVVAIGDIVAMCSSQDRPEPQQPNLL